MNRIYLNLILLFASFVFCSAEGFPNLIYIGGGYDIFKANPHSLKATDLMAGFRSSLFNLSVGDQPIAGLPWTVPLGYEVRKVEGCSYDSSIVEIRGEQSYHNSLAVSVSVEAGFPAGSFSASTDYKRISNEAYQQHTIEVHTIVQCSSYQANLQRNNPPKMHTNFVNIITSLVNAPSNILLARDIVSQFGTHVITDAIMGAKLVKQDIFSQNAYQKFLSTSLDIKAAAKFSWDGYSGAISAETSTELETQRKYDEARTDYHIAFIGSEPAMNSKTAQEWSIQANAAPFPHSYSLVPLPDFVTPSYFPSLDSSAVAAAQATLQEAISQWCVSSGGVACPGEKDDIVEPYHNVVTASGYGNVRVTCPKGVMLSIGFGSREAHGSVTKTPNYFIDGPNTGYCDASGENIQCNALCSELLTADDVRLVEDHNDDNDAHARCPDGMNVAGCANTFQNTGDFSYHQHATPFDGSTCTCWGYGAFTCQASCVSSNKFSGYEQAKYGADGGKEFPVTCPAGKRLLGCGIDVNGGGWDNNYIRVAPISPYGCKCWSKHGGACYAQCAQF